MKSGLVIVKIYTENVIVNRLGKKDDQKRLKNLLNVIRNVYKCNYRVSTEWSSNRLENRETTTNATKNYNEVVSSHI